MSKRKIVWLLCAWMGLIALLSMIDLNELRYVEVVNTMPKEGDNFRSENNPKVYLYRKGKKHCYVSIDAYYMYGNPEIGTSYEEGGILFVTDSIVKSIPEGPRMQGLPQKFQMICPTFKKSITLKEYILSFDKYYHAFFYGVLCFFIFLLLFGLSPSPILLSGFLCATASILMEWIQHIYSNGRVFSWTDIQANLIGVVIAMSLSYLAKRFRWIHL